jgi:hypothetical protein
VATPPNFQKVDPLDSQTQVVGQSGAPSAFLLRQWQNIRAFINAAIDGIVVIFQTGFSGVAPISVTGAVGATVSISHDDSGVTPGTYGDATHVAQVTVDAKGHVTEVAEVPITGSGVGTFAGASGGLANARATGAFATGGIVFKPSQNMVVTHVWLWIDGAATTDQYYAQISSLSSVTFDATDIRRVTACTVNAVLGTSVTQVTGSTDMRIMRLSFATPVALTAGQNYLISGTFDQASGTAVFGCGAGASGGLLTLAFNAPGDTYMGAPQFNTVGLSASQAASAVPSAYYQICIEGHT